MKKAFTLLMALLIASGILTACRRAQMPMATETTVPLATAKPTLPTAPTVTEPTVTTLPRETVPVPTEEPTVEDGNGLLPSQMDSF